MLRLNRLCFSNVVYPSLSLFLLISLSRYLDTNKMILVIIIMINLFVRFLFFTLRHLIVMSRGNSDSLLDSATITFTYESLATSRRNAINNITR